ncbi:MAG: rhomboid family intramembrane serine protease [Pseudomonadota bacterium]
MTILLIAINVLVFFIVQSGEDKALDRAYDFYMDSGLSKIEYPVYKEYLQQQTPERSFYGKDINGWWQLQHDYGFIERLQAGEIITPSSPDFTEWRRIRERFDELMTKVVFIEYGFKTAQPTLLTFFTHMFLHGGIGHLLGNMFFLFAVGFMVEAALGKIAFLSLYLLSGIGSAAFYLLLSPDSLVPGVGASGAISGLMGMYASLYWFRRIRFFYFLFFYFDYITIPAIALLPLWIGSEIFQIIIHADSNINFLAHLGGLLSGAALGMAAKRFISSLDMSFYDDRKKEELFVTRLSRADALCQRLEFKQALPLLKQLNKEDADHPAVLYRLHQCTRLMPEGDDYHRYSRKVLLLQDQDQQTHHWVRDTFKHYLKHAMPKPHLDRRLVTILARRFIREGEFEDAEFLAGLLIRDPTADKDIIDVLERLANMLEKNGEGQKSLQYRMEMTKMLGTGN